MSKVISFQKDISSLLSLFHDGLICNHQLNGNTLCFDIEIEYLASEVNPLYKKFFLKLEGVSSLSFRPWKNDNSIVSEALCDFFRAELEILESNFSSNRIYVQLSQDSKMFDFCGGELSFIAKSCSVSDEGEQCYDLQDIQSLCAKYWNGFLS